MNMLYGLRVQLSIGENLLIGIAEATACYARALPTPMLPKIISEKTDKTRREIDELDELAALLTHEMNRNKVIYECEYMFLLLFLLMLFSSSSIILCFISRAAFFKLLMILKARL